MTPAARALWRCLASHGIQIPSHVADDAAATVAASLAACVDCGGEGTVRHVGRTPRGYPWPRNVPCPRCETYPAHGDLCVPCADDTRYDTEALR